ncbi:hypothetical protein JOM56_000745 [Amanita muscaria]
MACDAESIAFENWRSWRKASVGFDPETPLEHAPLSGLLETVKWLLPQTSIGDSSRHALSLAVKWHKRFINCAILKQGANKYGNALQAASYGGNMDIVELLLDKGADVNA